MVLTAAKEVMEAVTADHTVSIVTDVTNVKQEEVGSADIEEREDEENGNSDSS